jgi:hypothetical protein
MYMYRDGTFGTGLQQMISGGLHVPEVNMNMMCMTACWLVGIGTHTLGLGQAANAWLLHLLGQGEHSEPW